MRPVTSASRESAAIVTDEVDDEDEVDGTITSVRCSCSGS